MAISRSLMNRQLRANGGIMDVTPRENFGLGSSLKKFVRKIIPNEVAEIATKAAPFVAPFNPALAGVMGGLGTFDQTGSIGSGLKAGAMNYGGGQLARYAGGAGFQGNPFGQGGAFTGSGFQGGLFSNQGTQGVQGIGETTADGFTTGAENFITADAPAVTSQLTKDTILKQPGVFDSITESIKNFDYKGLGNKTLELGKKFGKAMFTNKDGSIDKSAVMGAIAFAGTYAEALALADDAGVELTEGAYDEARKIEKQEEYAGYLTNFFGGKKDGGRIGFENGANEFMSEQMMLESNPGAAESGSPITIDTTMTGLINKYNTYKKSAPGVSEETRIFLKNDLLKSLEDAGISQEEFMMRLSEDTEMKANGGRIGYGLGNLVRGSAGVFQPTSASMSAGDAPSFEGGSGMGGMIADLIRKNPQMFSSSQNTSPVNQGDQGFVNQGSNKMFSNFFSNPNIYNQFIKNKKDFIDQNLNLIDDREEVAQGGRIGFKKGSDPVYEIYLEDLEAGTIPSDKSYNEYLDDIEEDPDYDYSYAKGGRVSRKFGSPEEGERSGVMEMLAVDVDAGGDDKEENMMMADISFNSAEKSFLFKNLAKLGGADRSINMPKLYGILKNPNNPRNLDDARMLKAFIEIKMPGFKSGGRIGLKDGSPHSGMMGLAGPEVVEAMGKKIGKGASSLDKLITDDEGNVYTVLQYLRKFGEDALFGGQKNPELPEKFYNKLGDKYIQEMDEVKERGYRNGGRIGLRDGTGGNRVSQLLILRDEALSKGEDTSIFDAEIFQLTGKTFKSIGGISEIPTGQPRLNQGGVSERDYRKTGGTVPVGIKERADDVPAMLSLNEFVMTADSVRGIGNGSIEEGSKKLYNTMKQAEQKGKIA